MAVTPKREIPQDIWDCIMGYVPIGGIDLSNPPEKISKDPIYRGLFASRLAEMEDKKIPLTPERVTTVTRDLLGIRPPGRSIPTLMTLRGHTDAVTSTAISPDGTKIASGSSDHTIKVWDAATGALLQTLTGHSQSINSVVFNPDGSEIASASQDGTIKFWDPSTGDLLQTIDEPKGGGIDCIAFHPLGNMIASASSDGTSSRDSTIKIWDASKGTVFPLQTLHKRTTDKVICLAFSPDGSIIASGDLYGDIKIWEVYTLSLLQILSGEAKRLSSIVFSPDGSKIASAHWDGNITIWTAYTLISIQTLCGHQGIVTSVAFDPKGTMVVSGSLDKSIRIWDVSTDTASLLQTLTGCMGKVTSVAFSADGNEIVSGCDDNTIRIWNLFPLPLRYRVYTESKKLLTESGRKTWCLENYAEHADKEIKRYERNSKTAPTKFRERLKPDSSDPLQERQLEERCFQKTRDECRFMPRMRFTPESSEDSSEARLEKIFEEIPNAFPMKKPRKILETESCELPLEMRNEEIEQILEIESNELPPLKPDESEPLPNAKNAPRGIRGRLETESSKLFEAMREAMRNEEWYKRMYVEEPEIPAKGIKGLFKTASRLFQKK